MNQEDHQVYQYLHRYIQAQGYSPLRSEIAAALGMSQASVESYLQRLWNQGYICYPLQSSGMIYLTTKAVELDLPAQPTRQKASHKPTSQRRQAIYHYIATYIQQKQYGPALSDIAKALGIGTTTVKYHVDVLKELGYLDYAAGKARSLHLTQEKWAS